MTARSTRCSDADGTGCTAYRRLFTEMADAECLAPGELMVAALHEELRSAVPPEVDQDPATDLRRLRRQAATWTAKDADQYRSVLDELGNGLADLNHPLIYRQLLDEMGVRLPPTASAQFADWPGFRETSFELPVFWLSLGSLPRTLLAETLGLNLAMELSGVGGGYRKAAAALRAYGFSTRFVDIHNTIDNVATGHSAWAADAINAYLAEMRRSHGTAAQEQAWSRVRVGFHSLTVPQRGRRRRLRGTRSAASRRPSSAPAGLAIA